MNPGSIYPKIIGAKKDNDDVWALLQHVFRDSFKPFGRRVATDACIDSLDVEQGCQFSGIATFCDAVTKANDLGLSQSIAKIGLSIDFQLGNQHGAKQKQERQRLLKIYH